MSCKTARFPYAGVYERHIANVLVLIEELQDARAGVLALPRAGYVARCLDWITDGADAEVEAAGVYAEADWLAECLTRAAAAIDSCVPAGVSRRARDTSVMLLDGAAGGGPRRREKGKAAAAD